jgi:hypothetical protein
LFFRYGGGNESCGPEDFVFSKGLKPGIKQIRADQITRRWRRHVKGKVENGGLGITADFYSLKHLNLDETAAVLDSKDASAMASHTTPVITIKHYLTNETERQNTRLQKVANPFA